MGNTAEVTVVGDTGDGGDFAQRRLTVLEHLWSRFIPTSDISRLNMSRGEPISVHPDTITLVKYLVSAHAFSNGYFDPTLLPTLVDLGYGASRSDASKSSILPANLPSLTEPLSRTLVDDISNVVRLPVGLTFDPGGLGKGLAADIVALELIRRGAIGACVNVGGDLRCVGDGPNDGVWDIDIESPFDAGITIAELAVCNGGVATSSTRAKRWSTRRGQFHHVISPATHEPLIESENAPVQVTVIGAEAVWSEILATTILVAGASEGVSLASQSQLGVLVVLNNGEVIPNSHWSEFQR